MRQLRDTVKSIDLAVSLIQHTAFDLPENLKQYFRSGDNSSLFAQTFNNPIDPDTWPASLDAQVYRQLKLHHLPNFNLACYKPSGPHTFKKPAMKPILSVLYDHQLNHVNHPCLPWIVAQAIMIADLIQQQRLPISLLAFKDCYVTDDHALVITTLGRNVSALDASDPIHHFLVFFLELCGWHALVTHKVFQQLQPQHQLSMTTRTLSDMARAHHLPCGHIAFTDMILKAFERRRHFGAYFASVSNWPMLDMPASATFAHIKHHFWPQSIPWISQALTYPHANFAPKNAPHAKHMLTLMLHIKNHLHATMPNHRIMQVLSAHLTTKPFDAVSLFHTLNVRKYDVHHPEIKQCLNTILAILKQNTHFGRIDTQSMCQIQHQDRALRHHLTQQLLDVANHLAVIRILSLELDQHTAQDNCLSDHIGAICMSMHATLMTLRSQLMAHHGHQLTQAFIQDRNLQALQLQSLLDGPEKDSTLMMHTALTKKQPLPKPHPAIKHLYDHACKQDIHAHALLEHALGTLDFDENTDIVSHGPQLQALFLLTLKYAKQHHAAHGGRLSHEASIVALKKATMLLENIKHTEQQKRQRNRCVSTLSKQKRLVPMLCAGGGLLALSFGLTGAMFVLPMEELMLFNTFLMGEELIALLMTSGSGMIGLWRYQQKQSSQAVEAASSPMHQDIATDQEKANSPKHLHTQVLIQKINQCLKDIDINGQPLTV